MAKNKISEYICVERITRKIKKELIKEYSAKGRELSNGTIHRAFLNLYEDIEYMMRYNKLDESILNNIDIINKTATSPKIIYTDRYSAFIINDVLTYINNKSITIQNMKFDKNDGRLYIPLKLWKSVEYIATRRHNFEVKYIDGLAILDGKLNNPANIADFITNTLESYLDIWYEIQQENIVKIISSKLKDTIQIYNVNHKETLIYELNGIIDCNQKEDLNKLRQLYDDICTYYRGSAEMNLCYALYNKIRQIIAPDMRNYVIRLDHVRNRYILTDEFKNHNNYKLFEITLRGDKKHESRSGVNK